MSNEKFDLESLLQDGVVRWPDVLLIFAEYQARIDALEAKSERLAAANKALREALSAAKLQLEKELKELGGCDHSVGICMCDLVGCIHKVALALGQKGEV